MAHYGLRGLMRPVVTLMNEARFFLFVSLYMPSSAIPFERAARVGKTMEEKQYCVYILASKKYGTLYTGITSNLAQRMYQHVVKSGQRIVLRDGFPPARGMTGIFLSCTENYYIMSW